MSWSAEQIADFAGKAHTAGIKLANAPGWANTGSTETLLWGDCQGSGKTPYRVEVNLAVPTYKCTCPSRQFPCKHVVALVVRWADGKLDDSATAAPDVAAWAQRREQRAAQPAAPRKQVSAAALAARAESVAAGLDQLELWLHDQVRQGLARTAQEMGWTNDLAKRMIDAKAPGVAAWLSSIPSLLRRPEPLQAVMDEFGLMQLLIDAYRRIDTLPDGVAAAVRRRIGFSVARADVLATPALTDTWQVLGFAETAEAGFVTTRMWLGGVDSGDLVAVQSTAASGTTVEHRLLPGREFTGGVYHYPGRASLRVAIDDGDTPTTEITDVRLPEGTFATALTARAQLLVEDPWLSRFPTIVRARPVTGRDEERWLVDDDGCRLPVAPGDSWFALVANTLGRPTNLLVEVGTYDVRPISVLRTEPVVGSLVSTL